MNKFLKILGGIFLALIIIIGVFAAIYIPKGLALNDEASAYFETTVPLVVANWDPEDLKRRAALQLLATPGAAEQLPKVFAWFSTLGKLKKLDKPSGRVGNGPHPGSTFKGIWGEYVAGAEFDGGKAQIKLLLRKDGDVWEIMGFHIESMALLPTAPNRAASAEPAR